MVPLVDFKAEYKEIRKDVDTAIARVLTSGWYILGKEVSGFEKKLAGYVGVRYGLGVASGTDGLTLAIKALGLGPRDRVLMPANVYPTVFGVALSGQPVALCDVDSKSLNVDINTITKAFTKDIKAIVVVHLYGNPVDIDPIRKFTKKNKVYLIEDCAQALGSKYKGKVVGSFGDVSAFSFYPTKNLGAYGDGGAVLTNSKKIFDRLKLLRMYGEEERYKSILLGDNSRLDEMQAGILSAKFKYLPKWKKEKSKLADLYKKLLKNVPMEFLEKSASSDPFYHLLVVKTKKRDELAKYLAGFNVLTGVHYPVPIHMTKTFTSLGYKNGDFSNSETASREVLSLPFYPQMKAADVGKVAKRVKDFFKKE